MNINVALDINPDWSILQYEANNSTQIRTIKNKSESESEKQFANFINFIFEIAVLVSLNTYHEPKYDNQINQLMKWRANRFKDKKMTMRQIWTNLIDMYKFEFTDEQYEKQSKYYNYFKQYIKNIAFKIGNNFYSFKEDKIGFSIIIKKTLVENGLWPETNQLVQRNINYREEGFSLIEEYEHSNVENHLKEMGIFKEYDLFCDYETENNVSRPEINSDKMISCQIK